MLQLEAHARTRRTQRSSAKTAFCLQNLVPVGNRDSHPRPERARQFIAIRESRRAQTACAHPLRTASARNSTYVQALRSGYLAIAQCEDHWSDRLRAIWAHNVGGRGESAHVVDIKVLQELVRDAIMANRTPAAVLPKRRLGNNTRYESCPSCALRDDGDLRVFLYKAQDVLVPVTLCTQTSNRMILSHVFARRLQSAHSRHVQNIKSTEPIVVFAAHCSHRSQPELCRLRHPRVNCTRRTMTSDNDTLIYMLSHDVPGLANELRTMVPPSRHLRLRLHPARFRRPRRSPGLASLRGALLPPRG